MSDSDRTERRESPAGPYGFTRREIVALVVMMGIAFGVVAFDNWRERDLRTTPAWAMDDVVVDQRVETHVARSADSAAPREALTARPQRDYASEIDINSADARALARLPGIGSTLAKRIIEERETKGPFLNLLDLQRVHGIGPRKAAMLSGWVRFTSTELATDSVEAP